MADGNNRVTSVHIEIFSALIIPDPGPECTLDGDILQGINIE
jgi:hypothetical protein